MTEHDEIPVLNPADAERKIAEISGRIANGVRIVSAAEREARARRRDFDLAYAHAYTRAEGPVHERRYTADIEYMPHREADDVQRTVKVLADIVPDPCPIAWLLMVF